jgi:hypothetical protein
LLPTRSPRPRSVVDSALQRRADLLGLERLEQRQQVVQRRRQLAGGLRAVLRDDVALLSESSAGSSGSTSETNFSPNSVLGSSVP